MTQAIASGWGPCPPGEITRLSAWLRFRRRLWTAAAVGGVMAAGAGAVGVTWAVREAVADSPARGGCHPTAPATDAPAGHDDGTGEKPATRNTGSRK
jgi:hypothetical protein